MRCHIFSAIVFSLYFFSHLFLLNHPLLQCSNILLFLQPQALVYVGNAYSSSTERCSCLCSLIRTVKYLIDHQALTKGKIHWYHSLVCHSAPSSVLSLHSLFCLIHWEGFPPFSLPYIFRCGKCIGQEAAMCIGHSQSLNVWSVKSCVMSSSLYGSTKLQNLKCFDTALSAEVAGVAGLVWGNALWFWLSVIILLTIMMPVILTQMHSPLQRSYSGFIQKIAWIFDSGCPQISQLQFCTIYGKSCMCRNMFVSLQLCLSVFPYSFLFLSVFLPPSIIPSFHSTGF